MTDRNGIEMKTGDIVEITGAYFKNDNGLYFITHSPGDPNWSGQEYWLHRISKTGKISKARNNQCSWPIAIYVTNQAKRDEAVIWNMRSKIEIKTVANMAEVAAYFQDKAESMSSDIRRLRYQWGESHPKVKKQKEIQAHYAAVAQRVIKEQQKDMMGGCQCDRL